MKVITLKQPWATLVAEGIKKYEFRTWKTNYRGKVLIHAGAGIDKQELEKLEQDYFIFSTKKYEDNKYSEADLLLYMELIKQHFYHDGIINCPYIEDNNIVDNLLLIPKTILNI